MDEEKELALLKEELIQLSVKNSSVRPSKSPTLLCTVWIKKSYNPDSLKAQLRSIWKTKKKFEILIAGHGVKDCIQISPEDRSRSIDELPYSIAFKAESAVIGKESIWYGSLKKNTMKQCQYTGEEKIDRDGNHHTDTMIQRRKMSTEEDLGNNPKTQEIRNERQMSRDKVTYLNTTKGSIIIKEKEEQNQSDIVEIQINELEIEKSTDGVAMQPINHYRNS
ncbi:hypothetical protein GOBAR_AA03864 [Gossypium barbadense]|uniref:DUF4283 domain-containing protein n=1 Tax=Gossypium barbadense TaxID=3634 RepID=A0A2P5YM87_GOSBA|nr:hypothetical protein GOBAR_AA03864 [Gossypium barbadense]